MQLLFRLLASYLIGSIVLASTAPAELVRIGSLPLKPRLAGFSMTANMEAVPGNGYQPIQLTFTPLAKSFLRDRHLQVVISPRSHNVTELDFDYRRSITLPEGSVTHSVSFFVPHYYPWESVGISLSEEGRLIETGKESFGLGRGLRGRSADQLVTVGIVAPSDAAVQDAPWKVYPDVRTLVTVLGEGPIPEDASVKRLSHLSAIKQAKIVQPAWVQFRPIDESRLPDHWLGYSQLDVIIVPAPLLHRIATQQRERFQQLRSWLAAGGNLWIYAADSSVDSIVNEFHVHPIGANNKVLVPSAVESRLLLTEDNDTSQLFYDPSGVYRESQTSTFHSKKLPTRGAIYKRLQKQKHPFAQTVPKSKLTRELRLGSFGLGRVVTIASEDPFPGSFQFWRSIVDLHDERQMAWIQRMGIDVPQGNDNYWMWLIPTVGQPPVKSFVLLNTLFVILVGPACYFFFRKRERLYLLYFFAPCLALLVTISLFAYALVDDGTKTKARARQITWVDSKNAYATGQSRQTYYAVLGNRRGIEIPAQAAIYPVRHTPAYQRSYRRRRQSTRPAEISIRNDSQYLSGAFLPPRNQVQYLITHPQPITQSLSFSFSPRAVTVTNHLPYPLNRLVVCDANRKYWDGEDLAIGESVTLKPSSPRVLEELLGKNVLPPLGSVPMLQGNQRFLGGPGTGVQVSLLENRLQQWSHLMPPSTFLATAAPLQQRVGVQGAVMLESVHVVMGETP